MQLISYVPIIFAISVAVVSFTLVIVGIYTVLVLVDFRKTLSRVNRTLDTDPSNVELVRTAIAQAVEVPVAELDKRGKKRTYVRKIDPKQFRGV